MLSEQIRLLARGARCARAGGGASPRQGHDHHLRAALGAGGDKRAVAPFRQMKNLQKFASIYHPSTSTLLANALVDHETYLVRRRAALDERRVAGERGQRPAAMRSHFADNRNCRELTLLIDAGEVATSQDYEEKVRRGVTKAAWRANKSPFRKWLQGVEHRGPA